MIGSLYTAISGLGANTAAMTVVGDNIANVSTPGFKSSSILFANIMNESLGGGSAASPGAGVAVAGITAQWNQGSLEPTGNPTDLAISGRGFFQVRDGGAAGTDLVYTRAGNFGFDASGYLTNPEGLLVQGYDVSGGPVATPPAAVPVNIQVDLTAAATHRSYNMEEDGIVSGINIATGNRDNLWQVALYDFPNLQGLTKKGGNLYAQSNASGLPLVATGGFSGAAGMGKISSGNIEKSNVDLATEFTKLIVTQKAFQANAKVITTSDEILTALIQAKR
ncbi:MAG: flagellar hook basal-body protein [Pseudomonadota bacterium]